MCAAASADVQARERITLVVNRKIELRVLLLWGGMEISMEISRRPAMDWGRIARLLFRLIAAAFEIAAV